VAGFSEHDTFRSNQIREGQITRAEAMVRIEDENRPRYANMKWYLDAVGLDFEDTVRAVNAIPRMYEAASAGAPASGTSRNTLPCPARAGSEPGPS